MHDSDCRVPSTSKHRVRVATFFDILEAYREFDGTDFEIQFVPDFEGPSLVNVMNEACWNGQDVGEAQRKFDEDCKQNPGEHQPAINGFFARVIQKFGTLNFETISRASAEIVLLGDLMISQINRMSLREFNAEWDRLVRDQHSAEKPNPIQVETDLALSSIDPIGREADVLIGLLEHQIDCPEKRLSQEEVVKLALGAGAVINNHRRVFQTLSSLKLIAIGEKKRGFFLTEVGKDAATRLKNARS